MMGRNPSSGGLLQASEVPTGRSPVVRGSATGRDLFVDYARGAAIVWVLLVHTFYHKDFFPDPVSKSYILFEMPLLFLVSGAALYLSHQRDPDPRRYLAKRLVRLLVPYALLAVVCIPLYYGAARAAGQAFSFGEIRQWLGLYPKDTVPVYVGLYMWFVRAMIGVSLLHLVLVRLFANKRWRWPVAALLVLLVAVLPLPRSAGHLGFFQTIAFYAFFLYLGYAYAAGKLPTSPRVYWLVAGLAGLALFAVVRFDVYPGDMQADKFPPNVAYGLFGIMWLSIFLGLRSKVLAWLERARPVAKTLLFYNRHSYAVYLWQGFGFWAVDSLVALAGLTGWLHRVNWVIPTAIYFLLVVALCAPISWIVDTVTDRLLALVGARGDSRGARPRRLDLSSTGVPPSSF